MMNDIAALQAMYGANFSTNSGNTVYNWDTASAQMFVNGVAQYELYTGTIFLTIWDGGGLDTYDFSNYPTNLNLSLEPGGWTTCSQSQLAELASGVFAVGNIANPYLYNNNPSSLIENAICGTGSDIVVGNIADNRFFGGVG